MGQNWLAIGTRVGLRQPCRTVSKDVRLIQGRRAGDDTTVAGIGIQVLIGGPNDTLEASLGLDTFVFAPYFGKNTITISTLCSI